MLELTASGDDGTTGLLGGGRARKDDPRIEAFGTIDEASSALGLAKALSDDARVREVCEEVQRGLYALGAELGTNPKSRKSFAKVSAKDDRRLETVTGELEDAVTMPEGFVLPGSTPASGAVDLALVATYIAIAYFVYHRAFVPVRPAEVEDLSFTPFEFQADYEDIELVTADGVNFGGWYFRQPGSPQTVIVSGGHKGQRQGALGISIALWRKGFNVIVYSYRGMLGSDRAPITFGIKEVLE